MTFKKLSVVLETFWIGGMWLIGLVTAPVLFTTLEKVAAGLVAGKLFHIIGWIGIVSAAALLIQMSRESGWRMFSQLLFWLLFAMLLCTLVNQFAIFPQIAALKEAAQVAAKGVFGSAFDDWHRVSSWIYRVQCLLALAYVWKKA